MGNTLYATMLGGFSLAWPDRDGPGVITDQDRTAQPVWTFLAYLCVNHQRQVEEAELIRAVWDDGKVVDPAGSLMTILQRARALLEKLGFPDGKNVLLCRRGSYGWAPGLELELDTEALERLCAGFTVDPERYLQEVLEFLPFCGGEFLPNAGRLSWASALRTRCRNRYLQLLRGAAEQLGKTGRYDEAIRLCRAATELDPFHEDTQLLLMRLLHLSGATQSALWHYKAVSKQYIDHLGMAPSGKLSDCYRELSRTGRTEETGLQLIRTQLEKNDVLVRPMYCDYPVFRMIYQWMARSMARTGAPAQLAMLTVVERDGTPPTAARCGEAMDTLKTSGLSSLREGDVCTRSSPNQYLLLLPSAVEEDAQMTLARCLTAFERTPIGQSLTVRTSVLPVQSIEL